MALDICFDRKTFLEHICRVCSRYFSNECPEEKMEFVIIYNDASGESKVQLHDEGKDDAESLTQVGPTTMPSDDIKEIFQEMIIWNLNIKPHDGLPQQICSDCMQRFRSVKIFRQECLDTQKVLESYFKDFGLLNMKSPKSSESTKSEYGHSPAPSFNTDDLVEEVPESPEPRQSPGTSPKIRHSPKFSEPIYAESSMGTPPPIYEEIKTEPIDVQTMEIIKAEAELPPELKPKEEIKEEDDELPMKTFVNLNSPHRVFKEASDDELSTTSAINDEHDDDVSSGEEFSPAYGLALNARYRSGSHLQCKICFAVFTKRAELKEHRSRIHPEERPYACNLCPSTFKSNFTLSQHKLKHNRNDTIRCELCPKSFRSQLHLQRHTKNFHLTSTYACHICHKQFENYTQIRFQYHVRQHGEKRFRCQLCTKSFHQKVHLRNHERTHTKEQPFQCDICGKSYRQQTACQEHRLTHSDPKPFKCKKCSKGFTQRSSLRLHYRIHADDKRFHCDLCGQGFTQKIHLDVHRHTHDEVLPRNLNQLKAHMEMHTNPDGDISDLESHMEFAHALEDDSDVTYCKEDFALGAGLKGHHAKHAQGYKTFKCQYCDRGYKTKQALQMHRQQEHEGEDKRFKCNFCEQTFLYRSSLGQHMLAHLGNNTARNNNENMGIDSLMPLLN